MESDKKWYALRVTYQQEMKVKYDLDSKGIESFIPMKHSYKMKGDRRIKELVPAVHNLIFVHIEEKSIQWHTILPQTQNRATTLYPLGEVYARDCGEV